MDVSQISKKVLGFSEALLPEVCPVTHLTVAHLHVRLPYKPCISRTHSPCSDCRSAPLCNPLLVLT
eukprot:237-Eustigmatos_ZCMA.PRE.1